MKIKKLIVRSVSSLAILSIFLMAVPLASAETRTNISAEAKATVKIAEQRTKIIERADKEIDRRIEALNKLSKRISEMEKVSDEQKASTNAMVQGEVASLTALKAKIHADTDPAVLKADVRSITASYRIFALIIQQWHILATADKITSVADSMTALSVKLQTRIDSAKAEGKDTVAVQASLEDMKEKIAEAKTLAESARTKVASLVPDGGDKTKMTANMEALKSARADIQKAHQDLKVAREDAKVIAKFFKPAEMKKDKDEKRSSDEEKDKNEGEDKND